uniref:Uncharacterized protein n=1 Tax=Candidatus Kentrum sp. FW TaxID=2126338 RepID=A0A450T269_9GAMM|nr:MAG: hypothetical protein BECKFW1821B_GA0114236_10584 [Candidatus Kentron sp. FW]
MVREIRERLQLVGAMIPETNAEKYFQGLRERAWDTFAEELYDDVPAGEIVAEEDWSFDQTDESAPHFPWPVRWHRSFAALKSLHDRLADRDGDQVRAIFGPLVDGILPIVKTQGDNLFISRSASQMDRVLQNTMSLYRCQVMPCRFEAKLR